MKEFEQKLSGLSKPEIKKLKHQEMISDQFIQMKRKAALSGWWILLPAYLTAVLAMKSFYFSGSDTFEFLSEFIRQRQFFSFSIFAGLPLLALILNVISIKKISFYSGNGLMSINLLKMISLPLAIIALSLVSLLIYFLLI
jgi:hypothetical protein